MRDQAKQQGKEWRSCGKKKRYRDEKAAREMIRKIHGKRDTYLDYYYCTYCNGYHLTSKEDSILMKYSKGKS